MNPKYILADSCFWYALFTKDDQYSNSAIEIYTKTEGANFILPWPILYEVINTKFTKDVIRFGNFMRIMKSPKYMRLDDSKYREQALEQAASYVTKNKRYLSIVDCVLREILKDVNIKVDFFITSNLRDFSDSIDWTRTDINEL